MQLRLRPGRIGGRDLWQRTITLAATAFAVLSLARLTPARAADSVPPAVPGVERIKLEGKADAVMQGEILLGELNCVSCHAAEGQQRVMNKAAPDLSRAGSRITPQYLKAYLSNPHGVKPGSTMPDIFHASAPQAKEGAVEFLVHYLMTLGGPMKPASEEGNAVTVENGRKLFHTVGCVACHAPEKPGSAKSEVPSIPLGELARKTTVDELAAFLLDPAKVRPGGRMPSVNLTTGEAFSLATYLLRDQLNNPQNKDAPPARTRGLKYTYIEGNFKTAEVSKVDPMKPKSSGRIDRFTLNIPGKRNSNYGVKYAGIITLPKDGDYTFTTSSDDGSMLYIDGKLIVSNDGVHPVTAKNGKAKLTAGDHEIVVTFFQGSNEDILKVEWEGPGIQKQEIPADVLSSVGGRPMVPLGSEPFAVDPQKAQMGQQMFAMLGCASCHTSNKIAPARPTKALAALNLDSAEGCLGDQIRKGVPNYYLSADQKTALKAAVKNATGLNKPLDAKERVVHTMASLNCYACHKRDNVGGPAADKAAFFVMKQEFDMGDEGKIPPVLTGVGYKLKPEAIEKIVNNAELHIRQALATRMPRFQKEATPDIAAALAKADAGGDSAEPKFSDIAAKDGRTLFGNKGLGCVNCHGVLGQKSLGMPAPDLTTAHERLTFAWYNKLLHDPVAVTPGTRMPGFWPNGAVALPTIAGGTVDGQIGATWSYLSLGKSMALPAGLAPTGGDELIAIDEPVVHRTFFAEIGPRALLVGYPEQLNVAFDANTVRLAKAWRGRFFDAKGMWAGRGGQALGPLGTDVMNLPPGPAFAILGSGNDAWPMPKPDPDDGNIARNTGGKFKGYVLDKERRPTFKYILNGVQIEEQPIPVLKPGGALLLRKFTLTATSPAAGLHFQAAAGSKIEAKGPNEWTIDGKATVKLIPGKGAEKLEPVIRDNAGGKQLIIPVPLNGSAAFEVEMSW